MGESNAKGPAKVTWKLGLHSSSGFYGVIRVVGSKDPVMFVFGIENTQP